MELELLARQKWSNLTKEGNNATSPTYINKIECLIINVITKKTPGKDGYTSEF